MKKISLLITTAVAVAMLFLILPTHNVNANAVSVNITGPSTVVSGREFSVTLRINANLLIAGYNLGIVYNSSAFEHLDRDSAGRIAILFAPGANENYRERTYTLRFRALQTGTFNFELAGDYSLILDDRTLFSPSDNRINRSNYSINVTAVGSDDATLRSIVVPGHSLSPAFRPQTRDYTVNVPYSVTSVTLTATNNQSAGRHSISNIPNPLPVGTTTVRITSTAPNGVTLTYTVRIVRAVANAPPPPKAEVEIDGEVHNIPPNFDGVDIPNGFEECSMYIGDVEVPILVGSGWGNLVIINTVDSDGNERFFIVTEYDDEKFFTPFQIIELPNTDLIVLPIDTLELPSGFIVYDTREIFGQLVQVARRLVTAAQLNGNDDFVIFIAVNDRGETGWFGYDIIDGTIQRYTPNGTNGNGSPPNPPNPNYPSECDYCDFEWELIIYDLENQIRMLEEQMQFSDEIRVMIIGGLAFFCLTLIGLTIYAFSRKKIEI